MRRVLSDVQVAVELRTWGAASLRFLEPRPRLRRSRRVFLIGRTSDERSPAMSFLLRLALVGLLRVALIAALIKIAVAQRTRA